MVRPVKVRVGNLVEQVKGRRRTAAAIAAGIALVPFGGGLSAGRALASTGTVTLPAAEDNLSIAWEIPNYPVGRQLRWLLAAATEAPLPPAELKAHFDAEFLAEVPPARFNEDLESLHLRAPLQVTSIEAGLTPTALQVGFSSGASDYGLGISVGPTGQIDGLRIAGPTRLPGAPTTWAGLDAQLRSLAPDVGFEAATLTEPGGANASTSTGANPGAGGTSTASTSSTSGTGGASCDVLNSLSPSAPRPLGSIFKLYVLATVASEVSSGRLSWDEEVPLTAGLRSLPSGFLQVQPTGSYYTVGQLADIMIPNSDNTAADRLAALAGRSAIEAQVATTSKHASLDTPFLRTRELFVLKYAGYPKYADAYLALPASQRAAYLSRVVDRVPLSQVDLAAASLATPRDIGSVEWFASPSDICSLYAQLYADATVPALAPVSTALSYNDGSLGLSRATWPLVWFKGGSETGVLTLSYLARRSDGTVAVVVLQLSDPKGPIAPEVTLKALADVHAAFGLVPSPPA